MQNGPTVNASLDSDFQTEAFARIIMVLREVRSAPYIRVKRVSVSAGDNS